MASGSGATSGCKGSGVNGVIATVVSALGGEDDELRAHGVAPAARTTTASAASAATRPRCERISAHAPARAGTGCTSNARVTLRSSSCVTSASDSRGTFGSRGAWRGM